MVTLRCSFCLAEARVQVDAEAPRPPCPECGRPFLLDRPRNVSSEDFEATVLEAELPVLVDFHAEWCGPCKWLGPYLDEVAGKAAGRLLVAKVDTDQAPELAARFQVTSLPTVILFRDGKELDRSLGVEPERIRAMAEVRDEAEEGGEP